MENFYDDLNLDFILCMSSSDTAPKQEPDSHDDYNFLWTLLWLPVLNVPYLQDENGMPQGISIVSKTYRDFEILNFIQYLVNENLITYKCKIP